MSSAFPYPHIFTKKPILRDESMLASDRSICRYFILADLIISHEVEVASEDVDPPSEQHPGCIIFNFAGYSLELTPKQRASNLILDQLRFRRQMRLV